MAGNDMASGNDERIKELESLLSESLLKIEELNEKVES